MKENAIRVSDHYEKVFIDFSTYDGLRATSAFKRLRTINTASTQALSKTLGFRIGGFCDEIGRGGTPLAAQVAGYEELPSDLILCRMDEKGGYRPLTPTQIEALFLFATEGKVTPPSEADEAFYFFERYHIDPLVPEFSYPMKPIFFPGYKNLVALMYTIKEEEKEAFEQERLKFMDQIHENLIPYPFYYHPEDRSYYLDTLYQGNHFYCLVQAAGNTEDERKAWILMAKELLQNRPPWRQNPHIDDD